MEKSNFESQREPEIVYSRSLKAGRRIYYLDVKKARNDDLYVCITESKRKVNEEEDYPQFEKHKIFLYKEDFNSFVSNLNDVVDFVRTKFSNIEDREVWTGRSEKDSSDSSSQSSED